MKRDFQGITPEAAGIPSVAVAAVIDRICVENTTAFTLHVTGERTTETVPHAFCTLFRLAGSWWCSGFSALDPAASCLALLVMPCNCLEHVINTA